MKLAANPVARKVANDREILRFYSCLDRVADIRQSIAGTHRFDSALQ